MAGFAENYDFASITEQEYADKLLLLAMTIEMQTQARLAADKLDCAANIANAVTIIRGGKKYDKIDIGGSGRLMIERSTGKVFGIKGYGRIHRGHAYGTLDTIGEWYWGRTLPQERVMCSSCGNNPATPPHPCPFAEEIYDNTNDLCTCCESCQANCAHDV